jgi:hypothetical protein
VKDLCGTELYQRLGLSRAASAADVRAAFRAAARLHHPDKKGGNAATFAAVRAAFEVRAAGGACVRTPPCWLAADATRAVSRSCLIPRRAPRTTSARRS